MAARCNQNILESFFSLIRGFGKFYNHPLPVVLRQWIKILMLSHSSNIIITNGNCCEEEMSTLNAEIVQNLTSENSDETKEQAIISIIKNEVLEEEEILQGNDTKNDDANNNDKNHIHSLCSKNPDLMKMLARYIVYRVKKKNPSTYFKYLKPTKELAIQNKDWLATLSRGLLIEPTTEWLQIVLKMEDEFNKFCGNNITKECGVMNTLINNLKEIFSQIGEFAILCYVPTRTFIRMKSLNKKKSQKKMHYEFSRCDRSRKKFKKLAKLQ